MGVRDPLFDRSEHPDERAGPARASGSNLPSNVAGLFEPNDPPPEGRRGKGTAALSPRELRLPALHVAEGGRNPARRRSDGADDPRLDRHPEERSFDRPTTVGLGEVTEELALYEVDGPPGAPVVFHGVGHDAGDKPFGCRLAESALEAVGHDPTEDPRVVRSQRDERAEREPAPDGCFEGSEPLGGPRDERIERRKTALPFGEEPVRVADRAKHRREVRSSDPHIVQDEDDRATFSPDPAEESGQNLGDREPPAVEAFVQSLHQRGGHAMSPP
jgi:hypothetical protein